MFNRDALFGKKDEAPRPEPRSPVNVTPGLGGSNPPARTQPAPEQPSRPDLRFAEVQARPQARPEEPGGSRLIVGPDIKLRGVEITGQVETVGEVPRTGEANAELEAPEQLFAAKYYGGAGAMVYDGRHAWLRLTPTKITSWDFRKLSL